MPKKLRKESKRSRHAYDRLEPKNLLAALPIITEFVASNNDSWVDDNGNSTDWIEIYNAGDSIATLTGYTLTDDPGNIAKWTFPTTTLLAGEYLIVFAGTDADPTGGTDLYTDFGLSAGGEYLGMYDASGVAVSEFQAGGADYPTQYTDVSYGLLFGGNFDTVSYFATTTPGAANIDPVDGVTTRVTANVAPGFFDTPISVSLSTTTTGGTIYYTTDGSTPSETNGTTYTGPITVGSTTNIRAVSTKPNFLSDFDRTWSYIFLDDVLTQSNDGSPPPGWPATWGNNDVDYGIDNDVVTAEGAQTVKDALLAIPTWSITTDLDNLFDSTTGIYSNANQDGAAWERPASVELLNPDGTPGFQSNAGLRIRGGFSRNNNNPKHSFRLFFRSEYGDSNLQYPIHETGTDTFEKIDLRTAQNYSWSFYGDETNNFITDRLGRLNQIDLGSNSTRSSWLHLYLNGQYWGLFETQERAEANFAASYYGGDADNYDVMKPERGPYTNKATDGNFAAYDLLFQQALARDADGITPNFVNDAAYMEAQGLNPDGSVNPNFDVLLDVENLINYMIVILQSGNYDAPISNFLSNIRINNYIAIRDRTGTEGFQFFVHDSEHSYRTVNRDRTGPYNHANFESSVDYFNPQWLHQQLMANVEYRVQFADKIQEAFFNGGVMTKDALLAKVDAEKAKIDLAIIAESARWGDAKVANPRMRSDWVTAVANLRDNIIANRNPIFLDQLRNTVLRLKDANGDYNVVVDAPLFPDVDAPVYSVEGTTQSGGLVTAGSDLRLLANEGLIYYMLDGSDPRLPGGGINPNAIAYDPTVTESNIFNTGSPWKYDDTGTDLGTAWQDISYNDNGWSSGNAQLGYGDGDEATVVSYGSDPNDKQVTTYFRKDFTLSTTDYASATFRIKRDDGAVIYVNGVELARSNMPAGTITYDTLAAGTIGGANEDAWHDFSIDPSMLVTGTNTIAVEIHQVGVDSSDITFDAELIVSQQSELPITINNFLTINSRTLSNGEWSALHSATYFVTIEAASASNFRISEFNYNPIGDGDAEYIEFLNTTTGSSAVTLDLEGVTIAEGPSLPFVFPAGTYLPPNSRILVVADTTIFQSIYPAVDGTIIAGEYQGKLSNSGEDIVVNDANGQLIFEIDYSDRDPWSLAADGAGGSVQLADEFNTSADGMDKYYSWRTSYVSGGTPGSGPATAVPNIVINEILSHTDLPDKDLIELHNPGTTSINISGWYLSDSDSNLSAFEIPAGTTIAAGGYVVFDEDDFNPNPTNPGPNDFALSSLGDEVWLTRVVSGQTQFVDVVEFGATFNGQSLGRLPNGTGRLVPMQTVTIAAANSDVSLGDISISEVNFHPDAPTANDLLIDPTLTAGDLEFVELFNSSSSYVDISGWTLAGEATYTFAPLTLIPNQALVVVSFDPTDPLNGDKFEAFENHYGVDTSILVVGPFTGSLSNNYGLVSLRQPDTPPANDPNTTPQVLADEVLYDDVWHSATDGLGSSLNRDDTSDAGTLVGNWNAAVPTPGSFDGNCGGCSTRKELNGLPRPFGSDDDEENSDDQPTRQLSEIKMDSLMELSGSNWPMRKSLKNLSDTPIRERDSVQKTKSFAKAETLVEIWNSESGS